MVAGECRQTEGGEKGDNRPGQGGGGNGRCHAGAPGAGDDYYPLYGNGGYDVAHYLLKLSYDPATDRLVGVATIMARATETLCRFNLDLQGLTVRSVVVEGRKARWARSQDHELTVTPRHNLKEGRRFTRRVQKLVHAACRWYSWSRPLSRSRRSTRRWLSLMTIGPVGASGDSSWSARWGRWPL